MPLINATKNSLNSFSPPEIRVPPLLCAPLVFNHTGALLQFPMT